MKKILLPLLIVLLGLFLHFAYLKTTPTNLTMDEVNNGYTAYSLLKTGKDEWGSAFPILFRSVGDFKPPILIYLTIPSVALFGLNEFAVRFPVALFSVIAALFAYLLSKKYLFKHSPEWIHLLTLFLFTVSPWLLIFSRSGYEAVVALSFFLINLYCLLEYFEKKLIHHLFLALFFAFLSAFTYHSFKLFVPLMDLLLILLHIRLLPEIFTRLRKTPLPFALISVFFILMTLFFIRFFIFGPGSTRAQMVFLSIDFDFDIALMNKLRSLSLEFLRLPMLFFFWFKRYLDYFTPNFYLYSGLELTLPGHPGSGVTGFAVYTPFLIGLLGLLFSKNDKLVSRNTKVILLGWLLLGFLPASLANNIQQPLRAIGALPAVLFIAIVGLLVVVRSVKNQNLIKAFYLTLICLFIYDYSRFLDYYLVHYPKELSEYRHYGWEQMSKFVFPIKDQYDHVFIDPRYGALGRTTYSVPYLYFLFYSGYDPAKFQHRPTDDHFNANFDNFIFGDIDTSQLAFPGKNLYIASPWSFPDYYFVQKKVLYEVKFLNGTPALYAISNEPK